MKKFLIILTTICVGVNLASFIAQNVRAQDIHDAVPEIYIKAINPGYTIDGKNNVGEMIEIARVDSDAPFSLAGAAVGYTNSSGKTDILYEFPENSWFTGESILLRLASSPGSELAAINYTKTIAMKGGLSLIIDGAIIDEICWTSKTGCLKEFKSANPTTLVRNLETGEFEHLVEYHPVFDPKSYFVEESPDSGKTPLPSQCKGIEFSELLSYYDTEKSEQFVELHNSTASPITLNGCKIRYKNKLYSLSGVVLPDDYFAYLPTFSLTKNPTNSNLVELIDTNEEIVDKLTYFNGQRKGAAFAWIGYDSNGAKIWKTTYAPTPGAPNNYQEYRTCTEGKVINPATGNCVKPTIVKDKVCQAGQYLNLLTGRCKKIESVAAKTCKEGYELNPKTNRCRKIKQNTGADYHLEPENYEEKSSFIALYAVIGVVVVGVAYLIYEFRQEILKLFCKVFRRSR